MHRWLVLCFILWHLCTAAVATAQSLLTFTLDFENFPDNVAIGEYSGVRFGAGWRFGDVRSGRYNAPFPDTCPDFGGTCAFFINGYGFGRVSGSGTGMIFLPAGVLSFSIYVSTSDILRVTATASDGAVIATAEVLPNILTGRLDQVTFSAPAGKTITVIEVSGPKDTWLIDDVQYTVDPALGARPARLVLAQRVNDVVAPGEVFSLDVVLENYGQGSALEATIELPFADNELVLLDAQTSRPDVWVSDVRPGLITIRTGALASVRDLVTITIRFRVREESSPGVLLGRVARFWYRDATNMFGRGQSNLPQTFIGTGSERTFWRTPTMTITGPILTYAADGFAPGEPVGIWYNPPGGAPPVTVTTVRADGDGRVSGQFSLQDLPAGDYSLVLFSHHSQQTFLGAFSR
ncbi:MAG: hypothetical protein J7467_03125 [Chloroflexus sp.]|nr:hypothetical protein [Chloroflexus sp.]